MSGLNFCKNGTLTVLSAVGRHKDGTRERMKRLFDLHFGASSFHLFLDFVCFFLLATFFEKLRCALDELLGFGKSETCDDATYFFNDANLIGTSISQEDVKFSLLFDNSSGGTTTNGSSSDWSSGANAPLCLEGFHKVSNFHDG